MLRNLTIIICLLALPGIAVADQGRTEIGPTDVFPIVIDTPGSYVLTADLYVTTDDTIAIELTADDIDLDLGGHVIRGPGDSSVEGTGIYGVNVSGVTLHNGSITEIADGINLIGTAGYTGANRFFDLTISHCGNYGIMFAGGSARDMVVHDVGMASMMGGSFTCTDCSISNVTVRASFDGFLVLRGTLENCTSEGNFFSGFNLRSSALNGGAAVRNGFNGINVSFGSVVVGATVNDNDGVGLSLNVGGNNNVINCTGYDNAGGNSTGCGDGNGCHQNYLP